MTATITGGAYVLRPTIIKGYDTKRTSRNVVHDLLGRPDPDVTLRPASTRSGTLNLVFDNQTDALEALDAHAAAQVFRLIEGDVTIVSMYYVVAGDSTVSLDTDIYAWTVSVDYREVYA